MKMLSSFAVLLMIAACGKKVNEKKAPVAPKAVSATRESQTPIALPSTSNKSGCSQDGFRDDQRNLDLSLFLKGEAVDEPRLFSGLIDGLLVRDIGAKIVTNSHKGQQLLYKYVSTDDVITAEKSELSAPSVMSVCPDAGKYERGSAESAALNATYFISKTSRKISELLPDVKIAPVSVHVAPMIKKALSVIIKGEVVWEYEAFETDNAYYMPSENSITFLPHSEEFRKAGMTMNFWEVPMVAAHEYGHHIFQTLHPSPEPTAVKNCFGRFGLHADSEAQEARTVTNEDVLYALNEGFADLVSYYTLENNERGLKGVPCLENSRDVGSRVFANGAPKAFSADALSEFFALKQSDGPATCDVPNFQDIHIIGAIFANAADRFMSLTVDRKDQRLAIVLEWLQTLKRNSADMEKLTAEEFLRASVRLFVDTAVAKTDGKLDQAECDILPEIYPGLDGYLSACLPPI